MKKTVSIMAGVLCLMACNKVEGPSNNNTLSVVASIDTQTKTAYEDYGAGNGMKVDWAESDSFTAYYNGTSTLTFSKSAAGSTFSAVDVPEGVNTGTQFTGLYGSAATLSSTGAINIDFSKQDGSLDNLPAYDVMTATSELTDGALSFAFKHKCAILRLSVINGDSSGKTPVKQVELMINDSSISSDFGTSGFTVNTYSGYSSVTFNLTNQIPYGQTATVYCVIPAITYKKVISSGIGGTIKKNLVSYVINTPESGIVAGKVYDASVTYEGEYCTNPE
ncbi:MAG: hypothetical protein ACI3Y4_06195 [Candidatus Cryptobacteroides sp.]